MRERRFGTRKRSRRCVCEHLLALLRRMKLWHVDAKRADRGLRSETGPDVYGHCARVAVDHSDDPGQISGLGWGTSTQAGQGRGQL